MSNRIVLIGGQWTVAETSERLVAFPFLNMPYCIAQTLEQPTRFRDDSPEVWLAEGLLRLHAFGAGGDLTVRRDEDRCYWRFVGREESRGGLTGKEFSGELTIRDEDDALLEPKALLYGKYLDDGQWQENVVGGANLNYPHEPVERVMIHAHAILGSVDKGNHKGEVNVVAYWTYKLDTYKPEQEGSHS